MTDLYIAYAREDRDRLRLFADMLAYEGWNVWMDPSDPGAGDSVVTDAKLNGAGAIVAVWSERARRSEVVRSEAATGLYKNKLIQVRIDPGAPPRPFDQVELIDLSQWHGAYDDANWRKLILALKRSVGEPQAAKPLVGKKKAAAAESAPPPLHRWSGDATSWVQTGMQGVRRLLTAAHGSRPPKPCRRRKAVLRR